MAPKGANNASFIRKALPIMKRKDRRFKDLLNAHKAQGENYERAVSLLDASRMKRAEIRVKKRALTNENKKLLTDIAELRRALAQKEQELAQMRSDEEFQEELEEEGRTYIKEWQKILEDGFDDPADAPRTTGPGVDPGTPMPKA